MHSNNAFKLDPRLAKDSVNVAFIGAFQIRISKDLRYPWLLLIPTINDITEIYQLPDTVQLEFIKVSALLSRVIEHVFMPDKLNVACIGNIVKQLHIHYVARFTCDETWPAPIWGRGSAIDYSPEQLSTRIKKIQDALKLLNNEMLDMNCGH